MTKKLVSLVLAALMLLCTLSAAVAEVTPETYTITISGNSGHTYEAYQIFTGNLSGDVLTDIELGSGVTADVLTFDGTTYDSAAELAKVLDSANAAEFTDHVAANLATVAGTSTESSGTYTITDLAPGYYLVKDKDNTVPDGEAYTRFIALIVNDVTAEPKSDITTHEKKVYENKKAVTDGKTGAAGNKYNDVADYCIGDEVPFALYSTVPDLTYYPHYTMIFHDEMSAGLTFDPDSVSVSVGGTKIAASEYDVITNPDDDCTFEVKIKELVGKNYDKGAEIRVDFTATLNANAEVGLNGNPNDSKLEFTNNPNTAGDTNEDGTPKDDDTTETPWDHVVVFTYELDVTKVDGADPTKLLEGAEFVLQNADNKYATVVDNKITGWVDAKDDATVLKSDDAGKFVVIGLDDGTYYLTETKAPENYNLLTDPIKVVITATTKNDQSYNGTANTALTELTIKVDTAAAVAGDVETGIVNATVQNNVGATLPETGGIGTTIFYVVGGILVLAAIVLLVTKRRVGEEN